MKKYLALLLMISTALFADAVIFSGNDVKALKANLDLNGVAKILTTTVDPSSSGLTANIGSIALRTTTGVAYLKTGAGNTAWTKNLSGVVDLTADVTGVLPILNGGTGSSTKNFVDLTTGQTVAGIKTFSSTIVGSINGNAATVTTNANLTGDVTSVGNATTIGAGKVTNAMLAGSIDLTSKVTGVLPVLNGGTGSSTRNFVDLSSSETIAGTKTFSSTIAGSINGNAATVTTIPTLSGEVTNSGNAISFANFSSAVNSSSPNATVPVVSLTPTNAATDVDFVAKPKGSGAFSLQVSDGTTAGGNKRGANAVDLQTASRTSATQVASGTSSFVVGNRNIASAARSSAVGGDTNQVTGTNGATIGGASNQVSGNSGLALAGSTNIISTNNSVGGGNNVTTPAFNQFTFGQFNLPIGTETTGSWVTTDPLFVLGNGTGSGASRSNAMIAYKGGDLGVSGGVAVGSTTAPVASAIFEATSTTKGLLFPRGTTTQKNAISSPAEGLHFFDTTLHQPYYYNGSSWQTTTGLPTYLPTVPGVASGNIDSFSVSYGGASSSTACTATPCTLYNQIGTGVSSVTFTATGNYTVNFARTYTKLNCIPFVSNGANAGTTAYTGNMTCASCASITFATFATNVSAANTFGTLMCMGSY